MKTVTSQEISEGQKSQVANVVASAARKAAEETLEQISQAGRWNTLTFQSILANGPKSIIIRVAEVVKAELAQLATGIVGCLKCISVGQKIAIPKTLGKRTIAGANSLFTGYLDPDFINWGCDVSSSPKPKTATEFLSKHCLPE